MSRYRAWGYTPTDIPQALIPQWAVDTSDLMQARGGQSILPFGNGRSYGDSCLNKEGLLLDSVHLDHIQSFDTNTGELVAESGCTLQTLLSVIVPQGWFLPVTPGTSFVSLGGAVANDVHGKNHHQDGTFGCFVNFVDLVRSDGSIKRCSQNDNPQLFEATIGGMGLTGFITSVSIQLIPINSANMDVRVDRFNGLDEFAALSQTNMADYQYTVAWLDCAATGRDFARGVFLSANHASAGDYKKPTKKQPISMPVTLPSWGLNKYSVGAFNSLYYWRHKRVHARTITQHYQPYFYPLDSIENWNRIYGSKGFFQYQFVVPCDALLELESILRGIVDSGLGSFLAVLKEFGEIESPGMMSFPRAGYCLALDFANRGKKTETLVKSLDEQVRQCGGAAYPAKDRLMSANSFTAYFPRVEEFKQYIDPAFESDFWRRVSG